MECLKQHDIVYGIEVKKKKNEIKFGNKIMHHLFLNGCDCRFTIALFHSFPLVSITTDCLDCTK